jgi:hypothetical protein
MVRLSAGRVGVITGALGETEGSWTHCISQLLKLHEGMAAEGER